MVKKCSLKEEEEIQRKVNKLVQEFCNQNPEVDTLEKFDVILEQMMVVATLPHALYEQYRNSGKTIEEVYLELMANN
jgi:hypothetical protein